MILRGRCAWFALLLLAACVLVLAFASLYLNSEGFHQLVRKKLVDQIEATTGGKVELRSLEWHLSRLEFDIDELTIHGLESASEKPYAHVGHLKIRAKIISLLSREIGLNYLQASRPEIHIIVNADGSTNVPKPKVRAKFGKSPLDTLFDLSVDRLEVSDGLLLWNHRRIPFDFSANKVSLTMAVNSVSGTYATHVGIGEGTAKYRNGTRLPVRGQADLELARDKAMVKSLTVSTTASRLEASGSIHDFNDPKLELTYKSTVDLHEFSQTVGLDQHLGGRVDLEGTGTATHQTFESSGRVALKNGAFRDNALDLTGVSAASLFTVNEKRLSLTKLFAQLLGGHATGRIDVDNWLASTRNVSAPASPRQYGHADLNVAAINVDRALSSFASRYSLPRLNVIGAANGNIVVNWTGSPTNSIANLDVNVTPISSSSTDELPLNAKLQGKFDFGTGALTLQSASITTRGLDLSASGAMGSESSELKLRLSATNLGQLAPLVSALGVAGKLPVDIHGTALFDGIMRGRLTAPRLSGRLRLQDFDLLVGDNAQPQQPSRRIHWDSLTTDLDYSHQALALQNGTLQRNKTQITFAGRTTLQHGNFDEKSVFSVTASVTNADLADVQMIGGSAYPLTGTLNARIHAQGTQRDTNGDAQLTVASGTIYGEPFKNLRSQITLAGQDAQLREFSLSQNGATVSGRGSYNLQTKTFRAEVHGRDFDLAHIERLRSSRLSLTGRGTLDVDASGTLDEPSVNGKLRIVNIVANGEPIGDINIDAVTRGREMQLTMRSQLEAASLSIDGGVHLAEDFPSTIAVHFENLDFDPVLRAFLQNRVTGHSSINGRIDISGPLKRWRTLQVHGIIPDVSAQVEKITLTNSGPIEFDYANQIATLRQMRLRGEGTDFEANGRVDVARERLDLHAKGDLNLKLVEGFYPGLLSYGSVNMELTVGGTIKDPVPTGQLTVQNAGVSFQDLPNGLSNINGTLVFNENRLQVQRLTAQTGGGILNVGGFISYQNGIYFDLTAGGRDVRLRYPQGISAAANADLRYSGTPKSSTLSGDVLVTKFAVNQRFDFALYVARGKTPTATPKTNPVLDNLKLDVHVTSTPELSVETQLAKIAGDMDLRIRGTVSKPVVLGRVNIAEGDIFFNSTKYHLDRGDILFVNPTTIEPIVNVEASARVREYDITLGFHGSVLKTINTTYRSEPPLPSADIIALLAFGRTREDSVLAQPAQQNFTETASNAILGQALDAAVSSRVQRLFGVSRVKIDPQVGGPESATGARVTIEQQVNENVALTYITNVARANQQIIQGEFNFTRDLSLVVVRDENGVLGVEFRIRQRKK